MGGKIRKGGEVGNESLCTYLHTVTTADGGPRPRALYGRRATRNSSTSREPVRGYEWDGRCRASRVRGRKSLGYGEGIVTNRAELLETTITTVERKRINEERKSKSRESSPLAVKIARKEMQKSHKQQKCDWLPMFYDRDHLI